MALENFQPIGLDVGQFWRNTNSVGNQVNAEIDRFQSLRDKANINALMQQNVGEDGTINQAGLIKGLAENNLGSQVPELMKQLQEYNTGNITQKQLEFETTQKKLNLIGQYMSGVINSDSPILAYQTALRQMMSDGLDISNYPKANTPEEAKAYAQTAVDNSLSAKDQGLQEWRNSLAAIKAQEIPIKQQNADTKSAGQALKNQLEPVKVDLEAKKQDPTAQAELAMAKKQGTDAGESNINIAEQQAKLETFKNMVNSQADNVISLIKASVESLGGKALSYLASKTGFEYTPQTATKQLEQIQANWLSNIPFPPGSQSDAEMKARLATIAPISDPDLPAETRIATFNSFKNSLDNYKMKLPAKLDSSGQSVSKPAVDDYYTGWE